MPFAVLRRTDLPGQPAVIAIGDDGVVPDSYYWDGYVIDNATSPADARAECAATVAAAKAAAEDAAQAALPVPPHYLIGPVPASAVVAGSTVTLSATCVTNAALNDFLADRNRNDQASLKLAQAEPAANAHIITTLTARIDRTSAMLADIAAGTATVHQVSVTLPAIPPGTGVDVTLAWASPFTSGYKLEMVVLPSDNTATVADSSNTGCVVHVVTNLTAIPAGTVLTVLAYFAT